MGPSTLRSDSLAFKEGYLRGWIGYFGLSEIYRPLPELDHWIRRRVRLCHWKMWKKPRRRMRALMKLGTHPRVAIHYPPTAGKPS